MVQRGHHQGGRIRLDQRAVDDSAAIIGENLELNPGHHDDIVATEQQAMNDSTRRDYRNRLQHIYKWWEKEYPEYYENGTRELDDADLANKAAYHHRNKRDLIYRGLNVDMIKAFLVFKKKKKKDKEGRIILGSVSDIKKYDDAIKWGAGRAASRLPTAYYREIEQFLNSFKKEHKQAKKEGRTEEQEADPIVATLFCYICTWAVESSNLFLWVYALAMWNLMSRSISIDVLSFHNVKQGASDSIKFKFDETKTDKTGEFVQEKNCYANPFNAAVCFFLALGCWISINSERLMTTERFFILPGSKVGSAANRFCQQLAELIERYKETACMYLRVSHANVHGLRKGSGIHASSGTTCPPSFVSVAARGEWLMGKVLDIYFKFALGGDQYLGRILALLDPLKESFAALPPHWKDPTHETVLKALRINFGGLVDERKIANGANCRGFLSLLLASIVHHSDWLVGICAKYPGHPFHQIPILQDHELLAELKRDHLTMEPNDMVPAPTGIPPHISHQILMKEVLAKTTETLGAVNAVKDDIREAVKAAIDEKVEADGGVNMALMTRALDTLKDELVATMRMITVSPDQLSEATPPVPAVDPVVKIAGPWSFQYKGTVWCVLESFQFAVGPNLKNGWRMWLTGCTVVHEGQQWKLKPFREMEGAQLPTAKLKTALKTQWRPIFRMMEKAPGIGLPEKTKGMDEREVQRTYDVALLFLRDRFSYIFQQATDGQVSDYAIGTWSNKVKRCNVEKYGTAEDIRKLPPETGRNKKHAKPRTFVSPRTHVRKVARKADRKRKRKRAADTE